MTINITDAAVRQMKRMLSSMSGATGIRFGVKAGGCSGLEYVIKPIAATEGKHDDFVIHLPELKVYINSKSIPYVEGTTIDWNLMGFTFNNPKAGTSCGCGSSFNTTKSP